MEKMENELFLKWILEVTNQEYNGNMAKMLRGI